MQERRSNRLKLLVLDLFDDFLLNVLLNQVAHVLSSLNEVLQDTEAVDAELVALNHAHFRKHREDVVAQVVEVLDHQDGVLHKRLNQFIDVVLQIAFGEVGFELDGVNPLDFFGAERYHMDVLQSPRRVFVGFFKPPGKRCQRQFLVAGSTLDDLLFELLSLLYGIVGKCLEIVFVELNVLFFLRFFDLCVLVFLAFHLHVVEELNG